jgi:hypothetical protein
MASLKLHVYWEDGQASSDVDFSHKRKLLGLATRLLSHLKSSADIDPELFLSKKRHVNQYAAIREVIFYMLFKLIIDDQERCRAFKPKFSQALLAALFNRDHASMYHAREVMEKIEYLHSRGTHGGYRLQGNAFKDHHKHIEEIILDWFDQAAKLESIEVSKQDLRNFLKANGGNTSNIIWTVPLDVFEE